MFSPVRTGVAFQFLTGEKIIRFDVERASGP
jgi:hypothetical protein